MSSELSVLGYILPFASLLLFAYAAYWAFSTRKALAVKMYRNQAIGVAMVSLTFGLWAVEALLNNLIGGTSYTPAIGVVSPLLIFILFFYWVDTSALAARRSDPLLRDTLHWRTVRKVLWSIEIVMYSSYFFVVALTGEIPGLSAPTGLGSTQAALFNAVSPFIPLMIFIPLVSGMILLPVGGSRSGDGVLHRNLKWFGLAAGLFFVFFTVGSLFYSSNTDLAYDIQVTGFLLAGFCLHRSAKSLAPLSRLSFVEHDSPLGKETSLKPSTSLGHLVKASAALPRR